MNENERNEIAIAYAKVLMGAFLLGILLYLIYWFAYLASAEISFLRTGDPRSLAFVITTICGFGILMIVWISPALVNAIKLIADQLQKEINAQE